MKELFTEIMQKLILILLVFVTASGLSIVSAQTDKETRVQALQLINRPDPNFKSYVPEAIQAASVAKRSFKSKPKKFKMKDGKYLHADHFAKKQSRITIILLHGVLSTSDKMNRTAGLLLEAANAEVFALNLRGHGRSQGTPGDIDHIDQYAEDVAQIIAQVRKDFPENKIILAGHSMGGGISLRFAMLKDHPLIDGILLFAPLLGQNTPTFPQPTQGKSEDAKEAFLKIHIERLIGLKMLNSIGEHQFDGQKVLFFNVPTDAPIKSYSYRANESMAPVDYAQGLQAVKEPLLVLVGSDDEAFTASAFENAVKSNSKGEVFVIQGATHNGVTQHARSMELIREWLVAKILK